MYNEIYEKFLNFLPSSRFFNKKKLQSFEALKGDASNRLYFRFKIEDKNYILQYGPDKVENLSFINIGNFLFLNAHKVPNILDFSLSKQFIILEDLGSQHLSDITSNKDFYYQKALDNLITLHKCNLKYFNLNWCFQSKTYNNELVLENEIFYFLNNLVHNYLKIPKLSKDIFNQFLKEADDLSIKSTLDTNPVFMHRDYQSKNIMLQNNEVYFIDWQTARLGPKAYDVASLLLDPYVNLTTEEQNTYLDYYLEKMKIKKKNVFLSSYQLLAANRLMQSLGAYGRYTYEGSKTYFEQYIPTAINRLSKLFNEEIFLPYPNLKALIKESEKEINKKCVL